METVTLSKGKNRLRIKFTEMKGQMDTSQGLQIATGEYFTLDDDGTWTATGRTWTVSARWLYSVIVALSGAAGRGSARDFLFA